MIFFRALLILSALSIASCVTASQAKLNTAANKIGQDVQERCSYFLYVSPKEVAAWRKLEAEVEQCSDMRDLRKMNLTESEIEKESKCAREKLISYIQPTTYSKSKFNKFMKARDESFVAFVSGDISEAQNIRRFEDRWNDYFNGAQKAGKGSYYNWAQCRRDAFSRHMPQSYPAWPALHEHLADVSKVARAADKSNMEPEDFDIEVQDLWAEFASRESQILQRQQAANAAAWRDWSRDMQQYSADLQRQQQTQNQTSIGPKNTNCTVWKNTMNCTEW